MRFSFLALLIVATLPVPLTARADDAPNAVDELKAGYALKQAGKCPDAIPHFLASYRADPKPKALLNLADCNQQTGDLVAARGYAQQGRDLALQQKDAELVGVADQQLASIDKRLSHLTLRLSSNAPAGVTVSRDGTAVTPSSFGVAIALNPGVHHVVATAPGHSPRTFDVTLAEGGHEDVEVQPGAPTEARAVQAAPEVTEPTEAVDNASGSTRTVLTYGALGLGGVGIVVGIVVGIAATSKHSTLESKCTGGNCPVTEQGDLGAFHSLRTASTIGYVVGIAGLAAGATLWLTAPKPAPGSSTAQLWVGPASAGVTGAF